MAKKLNVTLAFNADTKEAKSRIEELKRDLNVLTRKSIAGTGDSELTKDLIKAQGAAASLTAMMQKATSSTGALDLSKLNTSLAESGHSLSYYRQQFEKLGPEGSAAFYKVAQSIASAEQPLKRTSGLLDKFKTTLINTARWQISSSILHGFMGALQSAYGYAQNLNESLNNIRIVTGYDAEHMAKFANEANRAAKELSTTTTAYTDASLIFYQQGLSDDAVKERTDAVVKMSNVTRESEEEVSSYMTAIWNNFEGEKANLEEYADTITALGAATASSSAEIAGGLEKFAAIGQTIGLSYDYATTALATVVANTRQSEEVVGTAFKTIFARLQGLKLGETLDDGTDLNKYSAALKAVGVDIKDTSGELKDMDTILNEMGAKWQTLSKDQQVALAQSVAGTRQYTQLVALMDAWQTDFQDNLAVAQNSSGALQDQADIYAESWEAAEKRVKASAEAIYSDLLKDDFFIDITNVFADLISGLDWFIDSVGGLGPVLSGLAALIFRIFGPQIAQSINNMTFNIKAQTLAYKEKFNAMKEEAFAEVERLNADTGTNLGEQRTASLKIQNELSKQIYQIQDQISAEGKQELELRKQVVTAWRRQVEAAAKAKDKATMAQQDARQELIRSAGSRRGSVQRKTEKSRQNAQGEETATSSRTSASGASAAVKELEGMETAAFQAEEKINALNQSFEQNGSLKQYLQGLAELKGFLLNNYFGQGSESVQALTNSLTTLGQINTDITASFGTLEGELQELVNSMQSMDSSTEEFGQMQEAITQASTKLEKLQTNFQKNGDLNQYITGLRELRGVLVDGGIDKGANIIQTINQTISRGTSNLGAGLKTFAKDGVFTNKVIKDIDKEAQALGKHFNWTDKQTTQFRNSVRKFLSEGKNFDQAIKEAKGSVDEFQKKLTQLTQQAKKLSFGEAFTKGLQGISQMTMGITSLKNAWDTIKDPDASGWEKFSSILMSASMGLPMVISGFSTLNKVRGDLVAGAEGMAKLIQQEITGHLALVGSAEAEETITQKGILSKMFMSLVRKKLSKQIAEENANKGIEIGLSKAQTAADTAETAASEGLAVAKEGEAVSEGVTTAAKGADTVATNTLTGATITLETVLGPLLLVILAVVAALGVLVGLGMLVAFGFEQMAKNSPEGKLKAAEEEAAALADALEEAKSKAEALRNTFNDYDTIYDKLQHCTVGTQEWRDALQEASDKTAEILQQYPELLGKEDLFDKQGLLNPKILEQGIADAEQAVQNIQSAVLVAQAKIQEAQINVDKTQLRDSNHYYNVTNDKGQFTHNVDEDLQQLLDTYQATGNAALELSDAYAVLGYNIKDDEYIPEHIRECAEALYGLGQQSLEASTKMTNATNAIIGSWAQKNNINLSEDQTALMSKDYERNVQQIKADIIKAENKANSKASSEDNSELDQYGGKSVWELYQEASGTNYKLAKNGIRGIDQNREFAYVDPNEIDEKGKPKVQTKSLNEIADTIAAYKAMEQLGASAEKASQALGNLEKTAGPELGKGLKEWIASGEFTGMNQKTFNQIDKSVKRDGQDNYDRESAETYLKEKMGLEKNDNLDDVLGSDWYAKFNNAGKQFNDSIDHITDNLSQKAQEAYDKIDSSKMDQLTLGSQQTIAESIQKAFEIGGADGAQGLADQINQALASGADPDQINAFSEVLENMDWDTASIGDFQNALKGAGVDTSQLGIDVKQIFNSMTSGSTKALGTIQEKFKELKDVVKDLNLGDTIDDDQYKKLIGEVGQDMVDNYFLTMADGTHKLIGDAEEFYNLVKENTQKDLLQNIQNSNNLQKSFANDTVSTDQMNSGKITSKDSSNTNAALAYLHTLELSKEELAQLADIQDEYNTQQQVSGDNLTHLNELMAEHNISQEQFDTLVQSNTADLQANSEALLSTATTSDELNQLARQIGAATDTDTSDNKSGVIEGYSEALIGLASQYENCTTEIEEYNEALKYGTEEQINAARSALELGVAVGENAKKYDLNAEVLETQVHLIQSNNKGMKLSSQAAVRLATANQRLNRGVSTLNQNWSKWGKTLRTTDKRSQDYAEALTETKKALADLVGATDASKISNDLLNRSTKEGRKNLALMDKAAQGDQKAINLLGLSVGKSTVKAMKFNQSIADMTKTSADMKKLLGDSFDSTQFIKYQNEVLEGITTLTQGIENGTIKAGDNVAALMDGTGKSWVESLNKMAVATGMSVEEMNALLNELGVQAEVEVKTVKQTMQVPTQEEVYVESGEDTFTATEMGEDDKLRQVKLTRPRIRKAVIPGKPITTEGYVQVPQIKTADNDISSPPITYTGTSGGSIGGGVSPSSTPSSSSGGGGGGGGSEPKEKEVKEHKKVSGEKERYHPVLRRLEALQAAYDKVSAAKDRAFGVSKLNNIAKEIKLQEQLLKTQKNYLSQIRVMRARDKGVLSGTYGAKFDKYGNVSNYHKLWENQVKEYNRAVDKYNKSDQEDADKKLLEKAETKFENFKKALDQYEETVSLYTEQLQVQQEMINKIHDLKVEKIVSAVDAIIAINDTRLDRLNYQLERLDRLAFNIANRYDILTKRSTALRKESSTLENGLKKLLENEGFSKYSISMILDPQLDVAGKQTIIKNELEKLKLQGKELSEEAMTQLTTYADKLIEINQQLQEDMITAVTLLHDQWSSVIEDMDVQSSKLKSLKSIADSYLNIIDLAGQKHLGITNDTLSDLYQQQNTIAKNNFAAAVEKEKALKESYNELVNKVNTQPMIAGQKEQWKKNKQKMEADLTSAAEEVASSWQEALQTATDTFQKQMDLVASTFKESVAGAAGSLDLLSSHFDRQKQQSERYVADYEKIYQLSKLNRDLEKTMDESDNANVKKALLDFQQKIVNKQQQGVKMSQYELDYLQKEYELKKASLALDEAQNTKSKVQMRRNSEGSYSYVYTADQNAVAKAEQEYEDKLLAMQKANDEYINNLQENVITLEQEWANALQEVWTNKELTDEQKKAEVDRLQEFYQSQKDYLVQQLETTLQNSKTLYEDDWASYSQHTGYKQSLEKDWLDTWNETFLKQETGYKTLQEYSTNFDTAIQKSVKTSKKAFETWGTAVADIMKIASVDIKDPATKIKEMFNDISTSVKSALTALKQLAKDMPTVVSKAAKSYNTWQTTTGANNKKTIANNNATVQGIDNTVSFAQTYKPHNKNGSPDIGDSVTLKKGSVYATKGNGLKGWDKYTKGKKKGQYKRSTRAISGKITAIRNKTAKISYRNSDWKLRTAWVRIADLSGYDTGGYTGAWGSEGKLAMLHQKELVLNKTDTANFLKTVDMVRDIAKTIDLNAITAAGGLRAALTAITPKFKEDILQQEVTIHADFPNVTDRDQIKEAFDDLVNLASQYANRKQ